MRVPREAVLGAAAKTAATSSLSADEFLGAIVDDAELIESIEPEFEAKAAEEAAQSSGSVTEEPAGSR